MALPPKKQFFRAKFQRKKPGSQSTTTGGKSFFVTSQQEAIDLLLFEQRSAHPDCHIVVTAG
jgi:hypothetical protein